MDSNFKDKSMEEIYNSLLEILDEHEVSPEDGAVLSANLLFNSLSFLSEADGDFAESLSQIERVLGDSLSETLGSLPHPIGLSVFRPRNESFSIIGLNRIWGLDPALIDEEH
jgi:uncharacterized protein YejL (UPF0352 family)